MRFSFRAQDFPRFVREITRLMGGFSDENVASVSCFGLLFKKPNLSFRYSNKSRQKLEGIHLSPSGVKEGSCKRNQISRVA